MRSFHTACLFAFTFAAVACGSAGDDGQPGGPGTVGPAGTIGPAGDAGPVGPMGTSAASSGKPVRLLDERITGWKPANRNAINKLIAARGIASSTFDASKRPVAAFDWDNTVVKNDIGDATFFWMLKHDKVRQPAGNDWATTSAALTSDARAALNAACDGTAAAGQPLPTSTSAACADAIVKIYDGLKTPAGEAAWSPATATSVTMNYAYAWFAQLTAGSSPDEVRNYARAAFAENVSAPVGTTQTVGTTTGLNGYLRVYEQIADLMGALHDNGFDVWVVTASPQLVVDAISSEVGVPASHVLGIRNVVTNGLLTSNLEGCGTVADGANTMITFDEGKRCWINKVIFKQPPAMQAQINPDVAKRQVFAAGDSDTDIAFLKDATDLKLVINRGKHQVMCNALANHQNKWMVEPMFINPRPARTTPYDCPNLPRNDGTIGILDETGKLITAKSE